MSRRPLPPQLSGWVIVDGLPLYHRVCLDAGPDADAIVHVHGFGISGTYLEPTAALLAARHRTFVPDLVEAHGAGEPLSTSTGPRRVVETLHIGPS